jgi:hypothetical protein
MLEAMAEESDSTRPCHDDGSRSPIVVIGAARA